MKSIVIFWILLTFDSIESKKYTHQYCSIVCHNIKSCSEKCNNFIDNGLTANYQTPHCGITGFDGGIKKRVIGGYDSKLHQFPWFAMLMSLNGPACGGVILNDRYILTAAHCVRYQEITKVVLQTNSLDKRDIERIVINPMFQNHSNKYSNTKVKDIFAHVIYETEFANYDIALIRTSRPIEFLIKNSNRFTVNSICLPKANAEPNGKAVLAGIGSISVDITKPKITQTIELRLIDNKKCRNIIDESFQPGKDSFGKDKVPTNLTDNMFCTIGSTAPGKSSVKDNYRGTYKGDSGSPLIQYIDGRAYAIGISSFGGYPAPNDPTSTYTKISKYIDWIEKTMKTIIIRDEENYKEIQRDKANNKTLG